MSCPQKEHHEKLGSKGGLPWRTVIIRTVTDFHKLYSPHVFRILPIPEQDVRGSSNSRQYPAESPGLSVELSVAAVGV